MSEYRFPTPVQSGVKATFSRPSTEVGEDELVAELDVEKVTGSIIRTGDGFEQANDLTDPTPGTVLITEIDYDETDAEQTANEHIIQQIDTANDQQDDQEEITVPQTEHKPAPVLATVVDIDDAEQWDTDLEDEADTDDPNPPLPALYKRICDKHSCYPCSYFVKHIDDKDLNMKHHGFTRSESCALALALQEVLSVHTLDLEDNWLRNTGCRYLCRMLEDNENISDLNLAHNKLGPSGAACLGQMLRINRTLQSLSLAGNSFDDSIALVLTEALEDSRLRHVDLSENGFTDRAGVAIGSLLAANDYLETLNISWNMIRGSGAVAIAKGLKENIRLKVLNLSWNGLGEKGAVAIADSLSFNTTLQELDLSNNRLNQNVATRYAKVISTSESLNSLQLNDNPMSTSGALALITALLNSQVSALEQLGLSGNPVEFEFLRCLKELRTKRQNVKVTYGTVLRSGNTSSDLGKPAVDPSGPTKAVLVSEDNLIINNVKRLEELFAKYYAESSMGGTCTPEELIECLRIMSPGLNVKQLTVAVNNVPKNKQNKIPLQKLFAAQQRPELRNS